MEESEGIEFSYQKSRLVEREDWVGRVARWLGKHPVLGGIVGGSCVVVFAALYVPGALRSAPKEAAILSSIVVVVWAVLFYFMRGFFERMGQRETGETFRFEIDDEAFRWERDGEAVAEVAEPSYRLVRPPGSGEAEGHGAAIVWLVVEGGGERFVLETKVTAEEASGYPEAEGGEADESLPIHLASSLLQRAERAARGRP